MGDPPLEKAALEGKRRRRLRAVFAADVANFAGLVSVDETKTLDALWNTRRIATEELATSDGWLFGMPGDGLFALFESAVDAVRCALRTQSRLTAMPSTKALRLRIGVHLGEVLFHDNLPFGEALVIAARLESLAEPGGVLVSSTVKEAVEARISATFSNHAMRELKHIPRLIGTFSVSAAPERDPNATQVAALHWPRVADHTTVEKHTDAISSPVAQMGALPKAASLVLPTDPPLGRPAVDLGPMGAPCLVDKGEITVAYLAGLTQALMTHLGPVARVLVRRHAANISDPAALIAALVEEIPTEAERREFAARASQVVGRPAS
jgi:class 3 adenylate cyclase